MKTFSTTPNIARAADQAVTWLCGHQFLQATYWEPASKLYRSGGSKWGLHDSTRVEGVAREGGHHREWWAGVIVGWSVQGIVSDPLWLAAAAEVQDFCLQDFWFSFNFADKYYCTVVIVIVMFQWWWPMVIEWFTDRMMMSLISAYLKCVQTANYFCIKENTTGQGRCRPWPRRRGKAKVALTLGSQLKCKRKPAVCIDPFFQ